MAKNWKNFLKTEPGSDTEKQENLESIGGGAEGVVAPANLPALFLQNEEIKKLVKEREELEKGMQQLIKPAAPVTPNAQKYESKIPSFQQIKKTENTWLEKRKAALKHALINKLNTERKTREKEKEKPLKPKLAVKEDAEIPEKRKRKLPFPILNEEFNRPKKTADVPVYRAEKAPKPVERQPAETAFPAKRTGALQKLNELDTFLRKKDEVWKAKKTELPFLREKTDEPILRKPLAKLVTAKDKFLEKHKPAQKKAKAIVNTFNKAGDVLRTAGKKVNELDAFYKDLNNRIQSARQKAREESGEVDDGFEDNNDIAGIYKKLDEIKQNKTVAGLTKKWDQFNEKKNDVLSVKKQYEKKTEPLLKADIPGVIDFNKRQEELKAMAELKKLSEKQQEKKNAEKEEAQRQQQKENLLKQKEAEKKEQNKREARREKNKSKQKSDY